MVERFEGDRAIPSSQEHRAGSRGFGFVLKRDLEGKPHAQNQIVQLSGLESFIQKGLDEGSHRRRTSQGMERIQSKTLKLFVISDVGRRSTLPTSTRSIR
jgi:hypothetical protein